MIQVMWSFNLHCADEDEEEGLTELFRLGISRGANLSPEIACQVLWWFIDLVHHEVAQMAVPDGAALVVVEVVDQVRAQMDDAEPDFAVSFLEQAREHVGMLYYASEQPLSQSSQVSSQQSQTVPASPGDPVSSQPASSQSAPAPAEAAGGGMGRQGSQSSAAESSQKRSQEDNERLWARNNSFQKTWLDYLRTVASAGQSRPSSQPSAQAPPAIAGQPCSIRLSQLVPHGIAKLQDGLIQKQFEGDWSDIAKRHSKDDLEDLVARAENAIKAFEAYAGMSDSYVSACDELPSTRQRKGRPESVAAQVLDFANTHLSIWWPDEYKLATEVPMDEETIEEMCKRQIALQDHLEYEEDLQEHEEALCEASGTVAVSAHPPVRPTVFISKIRLNDSWVKRLFNHRQDIMNWGTANLTGRRLSEAQAKPASTTLFDSTDRGDKFVPAGSLFIMRSEYGGEGLGVFANGVLPKGTVVGQYTGELCSTDLLYRHEADKSVGGHYLSLRHYGTVPPHCNTIDGSPHTLADGSKVFDLEYFQRNGFGSLVNCDRQSNCNCKIILEYPSYHLFDQLYMGDEYCPDNTPWKNRVLFFFFSLLIYLILCCEWPIFSDGGEAGSRTSSDNKGDSIQGTAQVVLLWR